MKVVTFMLRIEDTDQERYVEGAVEIIYRTLQKTGLIHDEGPDKDGGCGPYVQSERQKAGIYMEYAKKLIEKGEAYYCFCDKERLDSLKPGGGRKRDHDVRQALPASCPKKRLRQSWQREYRLSSARISRMRERLTFHDEIYGDIDGSRTQSSMIWS